MTGIVIRESEGDGHRYKEDTYTEAHLCRWRQRLDRCVYKPRNAKDRQQHQSWKRKGRVLPSYSLQKYHTLDLRLLALRTIGEHVSVLSYLLQ